MEEVIKKRMVSLPEVKEILEKQDPESLDQIQRWTFVTYQNLPRLNLKLQRK